MLGDGLFAVVRQWVPPEIHGKSGTASVVSTSEEREWSLGNTSTLPFLAYGRACSKAGMMSLELSRSGTAATLEHGQVSDYNCGPRRSGRSTRGLCHRAARRPEAVLTMAALTKYRVYAGTGPRDLRVGATAGSKTACCASGGRCSGRSRSNDCCCRIASVVPEVPKRRRREIRLASRLQRGRAKIEEGGSFFQNPPDKC